MKKLIVLTGNIGTGKSTYASDLKSKDPENIEIICPDQISENLKNYEEIQGIIFKTIEKILSNDKTVVIDGNCMTRKSRDLFCGFAKRHKAESIIVDFGAGTEETLNNRINDPRDTSPEDWEKIHYQNQNEYEKPDLNKEFFDKVITMHNRIDG